jgi:hypothetical protein
MVNTRLCFLLAAAVSLSTASVLADEPSNAEVAKARPHYKRGVELYQDGAFDAALVELEKAYAIAPSYKILYNVGLVYVQLNDFAGALKAYRQYLHEGDKKLDAKRRAEVEKEIHKLEMRVGTVKVDVSVEGADILVDDEVVAKSPLNEPLIVNAGKRKIAASKSGHTPMARVMVIVGGDEKDLKLELRSTTEAPKKDGAGQTPKRAKPDKVEEPSTPVPWLWWGITGALAVGTTVTGVLTLSAQSDLDDKKNAPSKGDELTSAADKTRTFAIVTDVLLAGTVIVGGYATYKTFISPDPPEKDSATRPAVDVGLGLGSVQVSGHF